MNIKLTKEEWRFIRDWAVMSRPPAYRNYVADVSNNTKLDLLNMYDNILEKLGSEWVDDVSL